MAIRAQEWMVAVCKELGFDPNRTKRITIELDAIGKVTLQIEADAEHSAAIIELLNKTGYWANRLTVLENGEVQYEFPPAMGSWLEHFPEQLDDAQLEQLGKLVEDQQQFRELIKREQEQSHAL